MGFYIRGYVNVFFTSYSTSFMRMSRVYKTKQEAIQAIKQVRQMRTYIATIAVRIPLNTYGVSRAKLRELYKK